MPRPIPDKAPLMPARRHKIDWDADRKRRIYAGTVQMLLDRPELPKTPEAARKISDCIAFLSREIMELALVSPGIWKWKFENGFEGKGS